MKNIILLLTFSFFSFNSYSQGETNFWYFGDQAGIDFNTGEPIPVVDGQMIVTEGCATVSSAAGQLLFYTNGLNVWNKNHQLMPNGFGLLGEDSTTQSAIIVPKPNAPSIYYIFSAAAQGNAAGIRYSEVNMSLNGGLGDITIKNTPLLAPACEKITTIKNARGNGFWVLFHAMNSNEYYAHEITSAGVNPKPVISKVGTSVFPSNVNGSVNSTTVGYLKVSPDGTKMISCNNEQNVELYDFNSATGRITNPVIISTRKSNYGVEFSPSGKIAYITQGDNAFTELFQYDLTASNIQASGLLLYNGKSDSNYLGALQLAVDKKIYGVVSSRNFLLTINKPDVLGAGCNTILKGLEITPKKGLSGLPQFVPSSFFNPEIIVENNCVGNQTKFYLDASDPFTSIKWDFGDGTSSTMSEPTHTYTLPGKYTILVTITNGPDITLKSRDIIVSTVPTTTKPNDLLVCDDNNDGLQTFDLTTQTATILNGQDPELFVVTYFANNEEIITPENYTNKIPYQEQTIVAEVVNRANGSCRILTDFIIGVADVPLTTPAITDLTLCDNTTIGTDSDGLITLDLTQKTTEILNGQLPSKFAISYYKDKDLTQNIATPANYQNTNKTETIFVKIANNKNLNCIATTSFTIQIIPLPTINNVADIKQCDDDTDGYSIFNLEEANSKLSPNSTSETITFFKTLSDAENDTNKIVTATAYKNTTPSTDIIFARVTNSNNCYRISQLNLIISVSQIPAYFSRTFSNCDDEIDGTNQDGISSFNFNSADNDIKALFPAGQPIEVKYYRNQNDALSENNPITDITNYRNIGYPNTQNIYVRIDNTLNNDCLGLRHYITLNTEPVPVTKPIREIHCSTIQNDSFTFDTSNTESKLLNGLTNVTVTYYDQNNILLSSPLPNPFTTKTQTVKAILKNNSGLGCSFTSQIEFIVDVIPKINPIPDNLTTVCDDETDATLQDGLYGFDTSTFQSTLIGNQTGVTVNYYDENNDPLPSPLPNPFISKTRTITAEVINTTNNACNAQTSIAFIVNTLPKIETTGKELVCSNLPNFTKKIDAGLLDISQSANYNYKWFFNDTEIQNSNTYAIDVNKEGIYKAQVSNSQGCFRTKTITVASSDIAKITNVNVESGSNTNSITISATGNGNYLYAIDNENGNYQSENVFSNVPPGVHTVFVKDANGCGIVPQDVAVLGIPNYFTPNQDGYNDYWNIKGASNITDNGTSIHIFDRYGKLLKELNPLGEGWDGTYLGNQMPADDYWYVVKLDDGRVFKGHFALKR